MVVRARISEAAKELQVSESTIRRLIKKGKLKGKLFKQQRRTGFLPAPYKYHISREDLKEFLRERARRHS